MNGAYRQHMEEHESCREDVDYPGSAEAVADASTVVPSSVPGIDRAKTYSARACNRTWTVSAAMTSTRCGCRRSEEHTSELQSLMRSSYAVFCLKKNKNNKKKKQNILQTI